MSANRMGGAQQTHSASDVQNLCDLCNYGHWNEVHRLLQVHPSLALVEMFPPNKSATTVLRLAIRLMGTIKSACSVVEDIFSHPSVASEAASHVVDADGTLPMHVLVEPRSTPQAPPVQVLEMLAAACPTALGRTTRREGWTPLHVASTFGWNDIDFFRRLVQLYPLACCVPDNKGYLPAHLVCQHSKCLDMVQALLIVHRAAIGVVTSDGHTMLSLAEAGPDTDFKRRLVDFLPKVSMTLNPFGGPTSSFEAEGAGPTHTATAVTPNERSHAKSGPAHSEHAYAICGTDTYNAETASVPARRTRRSGSSSAVRGIPRFRRGLPAQDATASCDANQRSTGKVPNDFSNDKDPNQFYPAAQDPLGDFYLAESSDRPNNLSHLCDHGEAMEHGVTRSLSPSEALRNLEVHNDAGEEAWSQETVSSATEHGAHSNYDNPAGSHDKSTKGEEKENHHPNGHAINSQPGTPLPNRDGAILGGCRRPLSGTAREGRSPDVAVPSKKPRLSSDVVRGRSPSSSITGSREDEEAPRGDGAATPAARSPDSDCAIAGTPERYLPLGSPIVTKGPSINHLDRLATPRRTQIPGNPLAKSDLVSPVQLWADPRVSSIVTKSPASDHSDRLSTPHRDRIHEKPLDEGDLLSPLQAGRRAAFSSGTGADPPLANGRPFMRKDWSKRNLGASLEDVDSAAPVCPEGASANADDSCAPREHGEDEATSASSARGIPAETTHERVTKGRMVWRAVMIVCTILHLAGAVGWWWHPGMTLPSTNELLLHNWTAAAMAVTATPPFEENVSSTTIAPPFRSEVELDSNWRILSVDGCSSTDPGCCRMFVAVTTDSHTDTFTALGPCPRSILWDDPAGQEEGQDADRLATTDNDQAGDGKTNDSYEYVNYAWNKVKSIRSSWLHA